MSALTDSVYLAGWQAVNRVTPLATFDQNTSIGSAYWNLVAHLSVARGDVNYGGTPVSVATRAAILDANGNLHAGVRSQISAWINALNTAYPSAVVVTPAPVNTGEPFLGGILDGEVFGIPKKLLIVGGLAYFFLKK